MRDEGTQVKVLFEGSLEQRMLRARSSLLEYSKGKLVGFTLLSTHDDHMYVATEEGKVLRLSYSGASIIKEEDVTTVQSLRNPVVAMISEDVKRISKELNVEPSAQDDIDLTHTIYQRENLAKLLTKCVILEQKAEEKGRSKKDITFFKRAMDFLDDLSAYIKRLMKESKEVPISFALVEDLALSLAKIDTILSA